MTEQKQTITKGDIFVVDFQGLQGKRPCVVVATNEETVKVCPLTTNFKMKQPHPTRLQLTPNEVNRLPMASTVMGAFSQDLTHEQLGMKMGQLTTDEWKQLEAILVAIPSA